MVIPPGTSFGRYTIVSHLRRDVASDLYQAHDTQLERAVMLRVLNPETANRARNRSFAEDLRAASGVVHRNIAATYEVASVSGTTFVATEFIEGPTLRSQLDGGALSTIEATYVAVQVASAIVAAREAGLVHGDIRPDNIILKTDGLVKLLGLGQSELTAERHLGSEALTILKRDGGQTCELLTYASPERVRGINADEQADIWSIGVLLYEMVVGHAPFQADTPTALVSAILIDDPLPFSPTLPPRPSELDDIIRRALKKQKSERYGSAREMLFDLKRVWQRMEVNELVHRIHSSSEDHSSLAISSAPFTSVPPASIERQIDSEIEVSANGHRTRRFQFPAGHRLLVAVVAITVAAIVCFTLYRYVLQRQALNRNAIPFQSVRLDKLTTTGKVTVAAISPDGRSTVHAIDVGGRQSLWVRQLATTNLAQIVSPAEVEYQALTFSNDGNSVYYILHNKDNPIRELFRVPTFGGSPQRLLIDIDSPVSFSPDGTAITFVRRYSSAGEDVLMIARADGTDERRIATRRQPNFYSTAGPAWSPDGKLVAVGAGTSDQGKTSMSVVAITLNDGNERPLADHRWSRVGRVAWTHGGNALLVNAVEQTLGPYQIWQFSQPDGELRKITNDASDYRGVSVSDDATTIVTVQSDQLSNIWISPADNGWDKAKQISSGKYDGYYGVSLMPDGRLVYATNASGKQDVWIMDGEGGGQRQLTSNAGANVWPSVSPDGRSIIFTSDRTGVLHIWRIDPDGNNLKQLTFGEGEDWARFTPDGKWVVYSTVGGANRLSLWKIPAEGGQPVQVGDRISLQPAVSPDGKFVATGLRVQGMAAWKLAVFSIDGGPPARLFDLPQGVATPIVLRWSKDGRNIVFINTEDGRSNLWMQPVAGGPSGKVTGFTSEQIFSFDISSDGRTLAYARGMTINDVVTIKDSPK